MFFSLFRYKCIQSVNRRNKGRYVGRPIFMFVLILPWRSIDALSSLDILDDLTIKEVELEHGNSCIGPRSKCYTQELGCDWPMKIMQRWIKLSRRETWMEAIFATWRLGQDFQMSRRSMGRRYIRFLFQKSIPIEHLHL